MYNRKNFRLIILMLLFFTTGVIHSMAQSNNAPIKVDPAKLNKLRLAVEANPSNMEAHEDYLDATGFTDRDVSDDPKVVKQYEEWMKKFPTIANIPYVIGRAYCRKESPKAKPYLLKAVEIDPKHAMAYADLAGDAERWGDPNASVFLLKAKEADPKNADYAFYYVNSFSDKDPDEYKKQAMELVKNFPTSERGSQTLYWLARHTDNVAEKIALYELQRASFAPGKFNWTSSGMTAYFNLLLITSPDKAIALAQEMMDLEGSDAKIWESNLATAKIVSQAQANIAEGKAANAVALLEKVTAPRLSSTEQKENIVLLKAKAFDAAGKTETAYRNLATYYAVEPSERIAWGVSMYGKKLGKEQMKIDEDIWYIRDTASRQAPNFSLDKYFSDGTASLSDYKGKVVLLTYWFPGCGPCRAEFPHFENVLRKFKGKDVVYIGINIIDDQDPYVVPFMKSTGYSFIPLRDNDKWVKGPLDNRRGAPVNFLIDQDGKVIFSRFRTEADNEDTLETMISSMLERKKK